MDSIQARMKTEFGSKTLGSDGKEARLRDRQSCSAAHCGVTRISLFIQRNYGIVPVVATTEKNANQRSIVSRLRECIDQTKAIDTGRKCRETDRTATGSAQKGSSRKRHKSPLYL